MIRKNELPRKFSQRRGSAGIDFRRRKGKGKPTKRRFCFFLITVGSAHRVQGASSGGVITGGSWGKRTSSERGTSVGKRKLLPYMA